MNIDGKEILRVFPRKTKATPDDPMAVIGAPTRKILNGGGFDEVHISVTFTYDIPKAEELAQKWSVLYGTLQASRKQHRNPDF